MGCGASAESVGLLVLEAMDDPDPRVVQEAITASGVVRVSREQLEPKLRDLTASEDPEIAEFARAALRRLTLSK